MQIARKIAEDAGVGRPEEEAPQPAQSPPPQSPVAAGSNRDSSLADNNQAGIEKPAVAKQAKETALGSSRKPAEAIEDQAKAKEDGSQKQSRPNSKSKSKLKPPEGANGSSETPATAGQKTGKAKESSGAKEPKTKLLATAENTPTDKRTEGVDTEDQNEKAEGDAGKGKKKVAATQPAEAGDKDAEREFPSPGSYVEVLPNADDRL